MSDDVFEQMLLESAQKIDRGLGPARLALLKQSYAFFKDSGLNDADIKEVMALTAHEMQLIKKP